jgi:excisionase family DNA binding protein
MTATLETEKLLTRTEAAEFLRVEPQTLAVWASNKRYRLPYIKVGSTVRYRMRDLLAFLESRTVGVSGSPTDAS